MKTPCHEEAERCIGYRKRAKRGYPLTAEECAVCRHMLETFPEWYEETEERVFNETVPFGSNVKYSDRGKP